MPKPDLQPLVGSRQLPADLDTGRLYPWGVIVDVHRIGRFAVVEYLQDNSNTSGRDTDRLEREHGQHRFHAYIDGEDTFVTCLSLESALVLAIAHDREGPNSAAAHYFDKMTGAEVFE